MTDKAFVNTNFPVPSEREADKEEYVKAVEQRFIAYQILARKNAQFALLLAKKAVTAETLQQKATIEDILKSLIKITGDEHINIYTEICGTARVQLIGNE